MQLCKPYWLTKWMDSRQKTYCLHSLWPNNTNSETCVSQCSAVEWDIRECACMQGIHTYLGYSSYMCTITKIHNTSTIGPYIECGSCLTFPGSSGDDMLRSAERMIDSWLRRHPDSLLDPTSVWDDVVTNRSVTTDQTICQWTLPHYKYTHLLTW